MMAQASGGQKQNIIMNVFREGCISNENDFASVRLNDAADSPYGHGMAYETIHEYLFQTHDNKGLS